MTIFSLSAFSLHIIYGRDLLWLIEGKWALCLKWGPVGGPIKSWLFCSAAAPACWAEFLLSVSLYLLPQFQAMNFCVPPRTVPRISYIVSHLTLRITRKYVLNLLPPDAKNWLIGKDPDAGKDWRQEEKGTTEDEMVGWQYRLNGHAFEQTPGDGEGQGSLACYCPWGRKESDMTEWLNNNK